MQISEMIERRKSFRSYTEEPVEETMLEKIRLFASSMKPLYPEIRVHYEIVGKEDVKCLLPWIPPQLIAIYSEEKDGARENIGFLFQQMDLFLQSSGLGSCWIGMGKSEQKTVNGLQFVILLAFGHPKEAVRRTDKAQFKRKSLSEISDREDERLEPARIAPSAVNSQPWYFIHEDKTIHAYRSGKNLLSMAIGDMNRIDMGIALAHLYAANPQIFRFFRTESPKALKGYTYTGSFQL